MPDYFFADRIDCALLGRQVFLSGELSGISSEQIEVRRLRCSHQAHCLLSRQCGHLSGVSSLGLLPGEGEQPVLEASSGGLAD